MKKEAILHIPLSQFAYAIDEKHLEIRIRTAKDDCSKITLYFGDRCYPKKEVEVFALPMTKAGTDQLHDYYVAKLETQYTRVCYYFEITDGNETCFYCERGFVDKMDLERTEYFQFPFIRREEVCKIPVWAKDMVMYHMFPDSFADSKRRLCGKAGQRTAQNALGQEAKSNTKLGGTLKGITENIDYLSELGINCIYLNPVFAANSYHKYDTIDYMEIDPCFGTTEDMKTLVKECHSHGIRVLFDGVFNHSGPDFFAFKDVLEKGRESEYFDWFYDLPDEVVYETPPKYACFAYVKEMPKLNTSNSELRDYLLKVGQYWIKEVGIDGWRLDVANEIDHEFWRRFKEAIREVKPDALMIGEIWEDSWAWLEGNQMDSTMNYRFTYLCIDFFAKRSISVTEFDQAMNRMIQRYPSEVSLAQMNMLDSHDVPRFLSFCKGDRRRMELAFFYLFAGVGVPSVFYGDEMYLDGTEEAEYRQPMPWGNEDNAFELFKELIAMRKQHSALRNGNYKTLMTDDANNIYAFLRENEEEKVLIAINNSNEEQTIRLNILQNEVKIVALGHYMCVI